MDKITLICKPEQSGKTFVMIQKIIEEMKEDYSSLTPINFILCDNNLLLTQQTSSRVDMELREFKVNDSDEIYIEFSSHKRTKYKDKISVMGAITCCNVKNIICCTNSIRMDDIWDIIHKVNETHQHKYEFNIWLDEADKYITFIDTTFRPLIEKYDNIKSYLITSTPKDLFDKYKQIYVMPLESTTTNNYHGWNDNIIEIVEEQESNHQYIDHIMNDIAKDKLLPGTKWFIPAETKKKNHEKIKEISNKNNCSCIIVNGNGIKLTLPNGATNTFRKDKELNKLLSEIHLDYKLDRYPLVITGNICIGRGISIISDDFLFDFAIIHNVNNSQEASQIAGRLKGNIKHFPNYKPTHVYTTSSFHKNAQKWEEKSRNLARIAFDKQLNGKVPIITNIEFRNVGSNFDYIIHDELFDSYKKAIEYLNRKDNIIKLFPEKENKNIREKTSPIQRRFATPGQYEKNGYATTTKLATKEISTQSDRIFMEQVTNPLSRGYIGASRCISSTDKGSRFLILPVYQDETTPPKKEKYQLRYISFH